jgi:hypothetical protein
MERGPQANRRTTDGERLEYAGEGRWDRLQHRADGTTQVRSVGRLPHDLRRVVQGLSGEAKQLRKDLAQGGLPINPQQPDRAEEVAFLGEIARCAKIGIAGLFPWPKTPTVASKAASKQVLRNHSALFLTSSSPFATTPWPTHGLRPQCG